MMLGNLPPFMRSKVDNIKLVALCKEKLINKFGWKVFLDRLMQDMQILETEGVNVSLPNGETKNFVGSLLLMLGDHLGSHQIGGFNQNFSRSTYFCRFCLITRELFAANSYGIEQLRDTYNYSICAATAEGMGKICLGIRENSPLNVLKEYHVAKPGLPPCIAHDLFEGFVPYDLFLALSYFVRKKWFKYGYLNYHLQRIKLSGDPSGDNVPIVDEKKKKISGTATEIRKLLLIFPLAVAYSIKDSDDEVWQMVLSMRKISSFVCAPGLSIGQIALLKTSVVEYLELRIKCFPQVPLRPKHHYIMHYPHLIEEFGPLKHVSTLRLESKHKFFKQHIKHSQNFKNVTKTLSNKHQLMECLHAYDDDVITIIDGTKYNYIESDKPLLSLISNFSESNLEAVHYVGKKVSFRGIVYEENMCVCIGVDECGNFEICKIKFIFVDKNTQKLHFVGQRISIIENEVLGVYEAMKNDNCNKFSIFPFSSLLSPDTLPQITLNSIVVIVPKYQPFNPKS